MSAVTFDAWMARLDSLVESTIGLSVHDLPDAPYWDNWDAGISPREAFAEFAEEWWDMGDLL